MLPCPAPHVFDCRCPNKRVGEVFYTSTLLWILKSWFLLLVGWSSKHILREFDVVDTLKQSSTFGIPK